MWLPRNAKKTAKITPSKSPRGDKNSRTTATETSKQKNAKTT